MIKVAFDGGTNGWHQAAGDNESGGLIICHESYNTGSSRNSPCKTAPCSP